MNTEVADDIKKGKDKIIQAYEMISARCLPSEMSELLAGLRETVKQYVQLEHMWKDLQLAQGKVSQVYSETSLDTEDITVEAITKKVNELLEEERSKKDENFWEDDWHYSSLKNYTNDANEESEKETTTGDDIAVTAVEVQIIDPFTKKQFVDPVKNIKCNHSYERETIMSLLKTGRPTRCYHMGCNNKKVVPTDLISDDNLKRHLARLQAKID